MREPNKENIQKWVEALESGEYSQGRMALKTEVGLCCLGVACEVSGLTEIQVYGNRTYIYRAKEIPEDKSRNYLPLSVQRWLGVDSPNPRVSDPRKGVDDDEIAFKTHLANLNDEGFSFKEIAELIRAEWLSGD